jgi:hypothetical protein
VIPAWALLCLLACGLVAGCGRSAAPATGLLRTRAELARARTEVSPCAAALTTAVRRSRLSRTPVALGGYQACARGRDRVNYTYTITVRADAPTTMAEMSRAISGLLRAEGWRLVPLDFATVHLPLASTNHPLYDISQHGMKGAANILPYGPHSAGALVFMHSRCLQAGSLAAPAEQSGRL